MKLSYFDDFAFAGKIKNGLFAINPEAKDTSLLFTIFTKKDRDMSLDSNLLSWPGEYEFGGVAIQTFELANGELGVKLITENMNMAFLPLHDLILGESEITMLGNVDVLVLEISQMSPAVKKMLEEIDPKAVVPVGAGREKLLAEMGSGNVETSDEFDFSESSLPVDVTTFVKLQAS